MKNLFILFFILISFVTCKKEKIVIQEKIINPFENDWGELSGVDIYSTYVFDVSQSEDKLYFVTSKYIVEFDSNRHTAGLPQFYSNNNIRPSFENGSSIQTSNDTLGVWMDYNTWEHSHLIIAGNEMKNFKSFSNYFNIRECPSAVNDIHDKGLMMYLNNIGTKDSFFITYSVFSVRNDKKGNNNFYSIGNYKSNHIAFGNIPFYITGVKSFFGNYFINSSKGIYKVDTNSNYTQVLEIENGDVLQTSFKFNQKLYGVSNYYLYESIDQGNNWTKAYNVSMDVGYYKFKQLGNELFGYRYNELIKMEIMHDSLKFTTIDNKGIGNKQITGIERYYNNFYITTLAGTFIKPYSKLFLKP